MTNSEETGDETNSNASAEATPEHSAVAGNGAAPEGSAASEQAAAPAGSAAPEQSASPEQSPALEDSAALGGAARPEAGSPEAVSPDAVSPDAGSPEATSAEAAASEGTSPEGASPDATTPEAAGNSGNSGNSGAAGAAGAIRRRWFSWRGIVGAAAALVVAVGVLAVYNVTRSHDAGPLSIATVDSTGTVPRGHPAVVVIPIAASRSAAVVIDAVDLRGGDQRRAPIPLALLADRDESCSGIWWPLGGVGSFVRRCAPGGTVPLIGSIVPVGGPAWASGAASQSVRTIDIAIEVQAPGPGHCWTVGTVRIHYHVGDHHYTAVGSESIAGCAGLTAETAHGPIAADG
jgi:hypothetical protein